MNKKRGKLGKIFRIPKWSPPLLREGETLIWEDGFLDRVVKKMNERISPILTQPKASLNPNAIDYAIRSYSAHVMYFDDLLKNQEEIALDAQKAKEILALKKPDDFRKTKFESLREAHLSLMDGADALKPIKEALLDYDGAFFIALGKAINSRSKQFDKNAGLWQYLALAEIINFPQKIMKLPPKKVSIYFEGRTQPGGLYHYIDDKIKEHPYAKNLTPIAQSNFHKLLNIIGFRWPKIHR